MQGEQCKARMRCIRQFVATYPCPSQYRSHSQTASCFYLVFSMPATYIEKHTQHTQFLRQHTSATQNHTDAVCMREEGDSPWRSRSWLPVPGRNPGAQEAQGPIGQAGWAWAPQICDLRTTIFMSVMVVKRVKPHIGVRGASSGMACQMESRLVSAGLPFLGLWMLLGSYRWSMRSRLEHPASVRWDTFTLAMILNNTSNSIERSSHPF